MVECMNVIIRSQYIYIREVQVLTTVFFKGFEVTLQLGSDYGLLSCGGSEIVVSWNTVSKRVFEHVILPLPPASNKTIVRKQAKTFCFPSGVTVKKHSLSEAHTHTKSTNDSL